MGRELLVAGHAARRGAAVIAPCPLADPGPHIAGDHPVTLWTFHDLTPGRPTPEVAGAALAALHDACADLPGPLARLTPVHDQIDDALAAIRDRGLLPPATIGALHRRHAEVLADLPAPSDTDVVLHGDAHDGNLVLAGGQWRWTDFEEACRGPVGWDLAVLAGTEEQSGAEPGQRALAAYAAASGTPLPGDAELAPFAAARRLEATVWLVAMADADPDRYARLAALRLAETLA
jgi:Ser/Thr protein kinase RdoA (MazF antagonist)